MLKRIKLKTISVIFSFFALITSIVLNFRILRENISVSYLGQYGDYSSILIDYDFEMSIPLSFGLTGFVLGLLSIKHKETKSTLSILLSILVIFFSILPTWKLFFESLKLY